MRELAVKDKSHLIKEFNKRLDKVQKSLQEKELLENEIRSIFSSFAMDHKLSCKL